MDRQGYQAGQAKPAGQAIMEAIPGTAEHRATHGATGTQHSMEQVQQSIPGTRAYEATHPPGTGVGDRLAQHVPGTEQHRMTHGVTAAGGPTGMHGGMGAGQHTTAANTTPGMMGAAGMGTGMGAGMGACGAGQEQKGLGQKIKELIPGTAENRAHEAEKGMGAGGNVM